VICNLLLNYIEVSNLPNSTMANYSYPSSVKVKCRHCVL